MDNRRDPLRAGLTGASERLRRDHWLPPQRAIAPRIRLGQHWVNILWALPLLVPGEQAWTRNNRLQQLAAVRSLPQEGSWFSMTADHLSDCSMTFIRRQAALFAVAALALALAGCKGEKPGEPPRPTVAASAPAPTAARSKEQAMADLMALPELEAWSAQIEKSSGGKAHGAVIEDDPAPRLVNGKPYWQFSYVENRRDATHRRESFLVAQSGDEILVDDVNSDTVLTLPEWRRSVRKVELRSKD